MQVESSQWKNWNHLSCKMLWGGSDCSLCL